MRIPSQFNEDNLFRQRSRRNESAQTYRRLLRLLMGLALVVVVMRQASKPAIYETFFGPEVAVGAPPQLQPGSSIQLGVSSPIDAQTTRITPEDRQVALGLVGAMQPTQQREWVVALSRWEAGRPIETVPSSIDFVLDQLTSQSDISEQDRLRWKTMVDSLTTRQGTAIPSPDAQPAISALLAALDDAASARVVDGSVWRSGDFDLFYRYLDQASQISGIGVAASGVLPLLQQPDVFRNQWVRASGTVARAESIQAKSNPYGITNYWQLWIRPSDGADRPMVAVVPEVPALVKAVGPEAVLKEGPRITIVGRFFKRLAYQSSLGADLAPVVVGRITVAPIIEEELSVTGQATRLRETSGQLWTTITVASLVGIMLALLTMWRTSVMAKRARSLRNEHRQQPDDFLSGQYLRDRLPCEDASTEPTDTPNSSAALAHDEGNE